MTIESEFEVFPWTSNFNTGLTEIDQQHRRLVELLNQLARTLIHQNPIEVGTVFEQLADYARYHFETEEAVWSAYLGDSAWLQAHQDSHTTFLPEVQSIVGDDLALNKRETVERIVHFLLRWLAFHIIESDRMMAMAVDRVKAGESIASAEAYADEQMRGSTGMLIETVLNMYDTLSTRTLDLLREQMIREKAEAALRLKQQQLRKMMDLAGDAILLVNPEDGSIIDSNTSASSMLGYTSEELAKMSYQSLDNDLDDDPSSWRLFSQHIQNYDEVIELKDLKKSDHSLLPVEISINSDPEDNEFLVFVVRDMSERIDLINRLKESATKDSLTGVNNRRTFEEHAYQAINTARRYHQPLTLLMIDIDHFKILNDTYGHHAGDLALKQLAETILKALRESDICGRYGGDEFVVMLSNTDLQQGHMLAERLRSEISGLEIEGDGARLTVSIGLSTLQESDNLKGLYTRADQALYKAKSGGRDQLQHL